MHAGRSRHLPSPVEPLDHGFPLIPAPPLLDGTKRVNRVDLFRLGFLRLQFPEQRFDGARRLQEPQERFQFPVHRRAFRGIEIQQPGAETEGEFLAFRGLGRRVAEEGQLADSEVGESNLSGHGLAAVLQDLLQEGVPVRTRVSDPDQGQKALQGGSRPILQVAAQDPRGPESRVYPLQRQPRGVADKPVGMVHEAVQAPGQPLRIRHG